MKSPEKILKRVFTMSGVALLSIVIAVFVSACGNKDGSRSARTSDGRFLDTNCSNCPDGSTNLLGQALGFNGGTTAQGSRMHIGLSLFGQTNGQALGAFNSYSGPVIGEGYMYVGYNDAIDCPLRVGHYFVKTIVAGQWDATIDMFYGLQLEAVHDDGYKVSMTVAQGLVNAATPNLVDIENRTYPLGLVADIRIETTGGASCYGSPNFFFTY